VKIKNKLKQIGLILALVLMIWGTHCGLASNLPKRQKNSSASFQEVTQKNEDNSYLQYQEPQSHPTSSLFYTSLRAMFSLMVVVGLIYLFVHFLRKSSGSQKQASYKNKGIFSVVGRLYLSPKKTIYLVRIGEKILVLGVDERIHLLSTIKNENTIKSLEPSSNQPLEITKFSNYLRKLLPSKSKEMVSFFSRRTNPLKYLLSNGVNKLKSG